MKIPWLLSICLAVVLILFILFDKDNPSNSTELESRLAAKDLKIEHLTAIVHADARKRVKDSLSTVESSRLHQSEMLVLKTENKRLRSNPKVVEILHFNPAVDSLIDNQDSIISVLEVRIDTLASELFTAQKNAFQAEQNFKELIAEHISKDSLKDERIEDLEKQVKKARRGNKLLKVVAVVGTVGAFLLAE